MNTSLFVRKLANRNKMDKDFLIHCPSQGTVYCGPCKLFCEASTQFSDSGFSDGDMDPRELKNTRTQHLTKIVCETFIQRASKVRNVNVQFQYQIA